MADKLPTNDDEVTPTAMPEEVISADLPELSQHERKLALRRRERLTRLTELEDEQKANAIKHPNEEWDVIKQGELDHLRQLQLDNEL